MRRVERERVKAVSDLVSNTIRRAEAVTAAREEAAKESADAVAAFRARLVLVGSDVADSVHVLPLYARDTAKLTALARHTNLPPMTAADERAIAALTGDAAAALRDARVLLGARRWFLGSARRATAVAAVDALTRFGSWSRILESSRG